MQECDEVELRNFLVKAKLSSYAATNDMGRVEPSIRCSKQYEFSEGRLFYRDIYFGSRRFGGIETVSVDEKPVWSLAYYGGVTTGIEKTGPIYDFLKAALRQVETRNPLRGPEEFRQGEFRYSNSAEGTLNCFTGKEIITSKDSLVYSLSYDGGCVE